MHLEKRRDAEVHSGSKRPKRRNTRNVREPGAIGDHGAFTPTTIPPDLPPFIILLTSFCSLGRQTKRPPRRKRFKRRNTTELKRARRKRDHGFFTPTTIPGSPPFRYFTHFVSFFREANKKTPREVHTPAASSQHRLNFTGSAPSSSLVLLREDGQPDPPAPMDKHHAGSLLSQAILVLAAVIAVIDFQNMEQTQRQRAEYKKMVSRELKGRRALAHRGCVLSCF